MELKYTEFNGENVLTIKFNLVEILVLKNCKNWAQKGILCVIFFQRDALKQDAP